MSDRIYLDTSVYNRPFDEQSQPRIWLETLAFSVILQMIENNQAVLISSSVVDYENSRNPHKLRQQWVNKVLKLADDKQVVDQTIKQRALSLENAGLKALDALHISCAESAKVDCFITCDDRLMKQYQKIQDRYLNIFNPVDFIRGTKIGV